MDANASAYDRDVKAAGERCDRARWLAHEEFRRVEAAAFDHARNQGTPEAWSKYRRVRYAAQAECDRRIVEAYAEHSRETQALWAQAAIDGPSLI